ncbi:MAG: hypothetical protein ACRDRG_01565 [Pseudonocardiaceae bacterium]
MTETPDCVRQLVAAALPIATEITGAGPDTATATLTELAAEFTRPEVVEALAVAAAALLDIAARAGGADRAATVRQLQGVVLAWEVQRRRNGS